MPDCQCTYFLFIHSGNSSINNKYKADNLPIFVFAQLQIVFIPPGIVFGQAV
jgi:hypothetical protein